MFRISLLITVLCILHVRVVHLEITSSCECRKDYKAVSKDDKNFEATLAFGDTYCLGYAWRTFNRKHYCNEPEKPSCVCTDASAILMDLEGTWCSVYNKGVLVKKWPCENVEQWKDYNENYAKFEAGRKQTAGSNTISSDN